MNRTVCIAPMMGWTDRHQRFFVRQISRHVPVFTEMKAPEAILYSGSRFLRFHAQEHPVVYQVGGHDPAVLARAARAIEQCGFDEVNLNVGCPSELGAERLFGAHLMKEPALVAECLAAMASAVSIPVSIKTRIGVDEQDSYEELAAFVDTVRGSGCRLFTFHARKAWLSGLSCAANRHVPPLRYEFVYRIKRDFPALTVILNGGVDCWDACARHLEHVDGVMVGRRAYRDPYWLATVDQRFYGGEPAPDPVAVVRAMLPYVEEELESGTPLRNIVRHLVGLFQRRRGAGQWRSCINAVQAKSNGDLRAYLGMIQLAERLVTREPEPALAN